MEKEQRMAKRDAQGLEALLNMGQADTVPAMITDNQGAPMGPAKLSEGEFVFSVPAIVALGEGDYEVGLATLESIHNDLREKAKEFTEGMGLEGAV